MKANYLTLLLCFMYALLFSQNDATLDSIMKTFEADGFNGNVLYSRNDSIIFKGSYGYADFEKRKPLNDHSIFDLASLSKQFTALCIVQLIEKEKLSYNADVKSVLTNFPYEGITIEHLLRHQSGLPDYMEFLVKKKYWNRDQMATNEDIVKIMAENSLPLLFEPGTNSIYSNTGYTVLALIVERVSGLEFPEYLEKFIFEPLQMEHSKIVRRIYAPDDDANLTVGYFKKGKKYQPNYLFDDDMKIFDAIVGDGMIHSTILDMNKWKNGLRDNVLISEASKQKMFSGDDVSETRGCGFVLQNSDSLGKYLFHTGSWQGYVNFMLYIPKSNEFVVILSNNSFEDYTAVNNSLIKYGRQHITK